VRRVRYPGATAHSRQYGPAERARPAFAQSASLLGLDSRDGPTAQSNTGPQDRLVPFSAPVRNLDTKPGEARAVLATGSGRARTCRPWIGERPQLHAPPRPACLEHTALACKVGSTVWRPRRAALVGKVFAALCDWAGCPFCSPPVPWDYDRLGVMRSPSFSTCAYGLWKPGPLAPSASAPAPGPRRGRFTRPA
jgi:hypothetical protein